MVKKRNKRYMTLFEVLIAMSLLSLLLVVIFGFFRELSTLNTLTKQTTKEAFQKRYAESRLFYTFSNVVNENQSGRSFHFFTTKDEVSPFPSLVFTFQNGPCIDTRYGGDVLARLYVDQEHHLCLAIWPIEMDPETKEDIRFQYKQEYLLDDIQDFRFSFFTPPDTANDVEPDENNKLSNAGEWVEEWSKDLKEMPVIVKLQVKFGSNQDEVFAFVLPSSKHPITFIPPK